MDQARTEALYGYAPALLLTLAAALYFALVFLPAQAEARQAEADLHTAQERTRRVHVRVARLDDRIQALAGEEPEAVREALREHLLKGRPDEFLPPVATERRRDTTARATPRNAHGRRP